MFQAAQDHACILSVLVHGANFTLPFPTFVHFLASYIFRLVMNVQPLSITPLQILAGNSDSSKTTTSERPTHIQSGQYLTMLWLMGTTSLHHLMMFLSIESRLCSLSKLRNYAGQDTYTALLPHPFELYTSKNLQFQARVRYPSQGSGFYHA